MKRGNQKAEGKKLQESLIELGYELPRWGADGWIGDETFDAIENFLEDEGYCQFDLDWNDDGVLDQIPSELVTLINDSARARGMFSKPVDIPECFIDMRSYVQERRKKKRKKTYPMRDVGDINSITLHQMATNFGSEKASQKKLDRIRQRVSGIRVQFSALRNGDIIFANDILRRMPQAQRVFNSKGVGIECEGYYEGILGDEKTFWKPKRYPNRKPMRTLPEEMVENTRALIRYICEEVASQGGEILHIHAHRQTANSRISDPGSLLWDAFGIWAQEELGLTDGGDDYYVRYSSKKRGKVRITQGRPIPKEWDPKRKHGYKHRPLNPSTPE